MARGPGIFVDQTRFPLIEVVQIGQCTDAQVQSYLDELIAVRRRQCFAVLLDVRAGVPFNARQRKLQSAWMTENADEMGRCLGIAFVEDSLLMRGAMQAAFWLNPPTYEYLVTKDLERAHTWLGSILTHYGLRAAA